VVSAAETASGGWNSGGVTGMVWHRLLFSTGNILSSFVLGIIALFLVALNFENAFQSILKFAGVIEYQLVNTGLIPIKYNNLVELLIGKHQIVLMMFVLGVRIITSFFYGLFAKFVLKLDD
jgi:hypothetical protein